MADSLLAVGGAVPFDKTSAEEENRFHHYVGNEIPWFIRGVWVLFWCFAIAYSPSYSRHHDFRATPVEGLRLLPISAAAALVG